MRSISKLSPSPKTTTTLSEVVDHYTTVTNTHGDKTLVSHYLTHSQNTVQCHSKKNSMLTSKGKKNVPNKKGT